MTASPTPPIIFVITAGGNIERPEKQTVSVLMRHLKTLPIRAPKLGRSA